MYDIAIVGLGPAGANFARMIDSDKYRVAAIDKKGIKNRRGFKKPCGGLLAPDAQRSLARFNLSLPGEILASPQIFYVKTIDLDSGITKNYQRFYINIVRHKFDLWMMSLIPSSVDIYDGSVVASVREVDSAYDITIRKNGETRHIQAKYVIGADGANSVVSKTFFDKSENTLRISIQEWYEKRNKEPFFSCIFDSENCDSYSWFLSKDEAFIFGGAYAMGNAKQAFERQKEKLEKYGIDMSMPIKREACYVCRLRSVRDFCLGRGNVIMIGEAAGFVSPSSYEGISGALDSSYLLSEIINAGKDDVLKQYKKATRRMRVKFGLKIAKSRILDSNFLRRLIMKSGVQSLDVME